MAETKEAKEAINKAAVALKRALQSGTVEEIAAAHMAFGAAFDAYWLTL